MFYIRLALTLLGFFAASFYGVAIAVFRRDKQYVAYDYARMLVRLVRPPLGMKVEVRGRENLIPGRPSVNIANHQSVYDVPMLAELYTPDGVVIGKKELRQIPLFGWLYAVTGNVFIDRSNREAAVYRLKEAEEAILERRRTVWIFPEGTRGVVPGELLPFKKGAFYMAVATGAPLVPVVASPVSPIFNLRERRILPGTVQVSILEPVETTGMTSAEVPALIKDVHQRMSDELQRLQTRPD